MDEPSSTTRFIRRTFRSNPDVLRCARRLNLLGEWELWLHRAERRLASDPDVALRRALDRHWVALHTRRGDADAAISVAARIRKSGAEPRELLACCRSSPARSSCVTISTPPSEASRKPGRNSDGSDVDRRGRAAVEPCARVLLDRLAAPRVEHGRHAIAAARVSHLEQHPALFDARLARCGVLCERFEVGTRPTSSIGSGDPRRTKSISRSW